MFVYWVMFLVPAVALLVPVRGTDSIRILSFYVVGAFFVVILGLRFQIGADWGNHIRYFNEYSDAQFIRVITSPEPGFLFLNWLSGVVGGEVYFVNVLCAAIFMTGIIKFSVRQPLPWLAFLVSVPYLIIVVSMGYVRQGVAIGFELLALVALSDARVRLFICYVMCGFLFHMSAIILLPFALLVKSPKVLKTFVLVGVISSVFILVVYAEYFEILWLYYSSGVLNSEGGLLRVSMNVVPAVLFLVFRKKMLTKGENGHIWIWMSIASLLCVPLVLIASTFVDRIALYFIPLQIFVFSRVHYLFPDSLLRTIVVIGVVAGYGLVQFVWLNFANLASSWVPYQFAPFAKL